MQMNNQHTQLIPPFRFAIVEEGLFRGSYPTDRNFRFLKRLKLKTIISLTPKPPTKSFYTFCERQGTIGKHFSVSKFKDDVTLSASQVVQLLEIMIDPSNLPLYIHCLDGANVTGTIFMCLRKLQNWNLSSIFTEFTRFTRGGTIASAEAEFVETFKAEIDVSPNIPNWLWQGIRMTKHPTLKLRLVGANPTIDNSLLSSSNSNYLFNQLSNNIVNNPIRLSKDNNNLNISQSVSSPLSASTLTQNTTINNPISASASIFSTVPSSTTNIVGSSQIPSSVSTLPSSTIPSITSTVTTNTTSTVTSNPINQQILITSTSSPRPISQKEKDKKKKVIDDIKLQFDSGKFSTQKESRSLQALDLERSKSTHTQTSPTTSSSSSSHQSQQHQHSYQSTSHSQSQSPTTVTPTDLKSKTPLILSSNLLFKNNNNNNNNNNNSN